MAIKTVFERAGAFTEPTHLAVARIDGKYGYANDRGEIAVKPAFAAAEDFTGNGMARVRPAGTDGFASLAADGRVMLSEDTTNGVPVLRNDVGTVVWPNVPAERAPDPRTGDYTPHTLVMPKDDSGAPLVLIFPSQKTRETEGRAYKITPEGVQNHPGERRPHDGVRL